MAKTKAIITYIIATFIIIFIENLSGVLLNIYHYLDIILGIFLDVIAPMSPTTGKWADSAKNAIFMANMVRFFFRIISSPIPLIIAVLVYVIDIQEFYH